MKDKQIYALVVILLITGLVFLTLFKYGDYNYSICDTSTGIVSCDKSCTTLGTVSFIADERKNFTLANFYLNDKTSYQVETFENCKIMDKDNWTCIKEYDDEGSKRTVKATLSSGIFRVSNVSEQFRFYGCAIKRNIFDFSNHYD